MAANSSAENEVAASLASGETTVVAETSFLSDIMSTVQNIGLLIAGVALLMGVVRSLAQRLRLSRTPPVVCVQNLYYRQNSILFHPEVSGMPKHPHENPAPYSSPGMLPALACTAQSLLLEAPVLLATAVGLRAYAAF